MVWMAGRTARQGRIDRSKVLRPIEEKIDKLLEHQGIQYDPNANIPDEIRAAMDRGEIIEAIRLYRETSGTGLKEAKEFIEKLASAETRISNKHDALLKNAGS
jgi:hypothetical protein